MPVSVPGITQPIAADTNVAGEAVQRININDEVIVDHVVVATAGVSAVSASGTAKTLAASNVNRRALIVYNDASHDMLVKYGAGASAASFTVRIKSKGYWEMPQTLYSGLVSAIWENATPTGNAMVTEV